MRELSEKPVRTDARAPGRASVLAVAAGTFTVVTAEMTPVGLLTPIGASLGVGAGTAGWTLTVTGLVAAATAPFVPRAAGRADRRTALIVLMLLLAAANLLAAWAPNFGVLLAARVLVGLGMGGVWALAAGLAPRLVPPRAVPAATSTIFGGVAAASVLGVPMGAFVQALVGWRAAFVAVAALAVAAACAMAALLPPLPAAEPASEGRGARRLRGRRAVATGITVTILLVTGHFAAYTFVRPVLEDTAGLGPGAVGTLLLLYGIAGVAGNFAAGLRAPAAPRATLAVLAAGVAGAVALVPLFGTTHAGASVLMVVWGLAYGGVSVGVQTWLLAASGPDEAERVTALFVGVFNGGIALGAFAGGLVTDTAGTGPLMVFAAALAAAALGVTLTAARRGR
ncbi:MFS transporter [Actinomadura algeriensis]|uniref:MFS family arabinose efflux permease n=1 Tax=Actinomadura algeriensis TaxID=1679523 RepID=A0ABR9JV69_9ACTN|nr:MFS transporter [Actinomadura algeriensis]MBE1534373.1 putative MFS family arabinose efflux permease [Actinomadura algeriensis]